MEQVQGQPQQQPTQSSAATAGQPTASGNRHTGKCKFFDCQKGFGFIIPDEPIDGNSVEIFVHHTSIVNNGGFRSLAEGESVEFDLIQGAKGLQATNVTGPGGASVKGDPRGGQRPNNFMQNGMFQTNRRNNFYGQRQNFNNGYGQGFTNPNFQQNPWGGYGYGMQQQNQYQKMPGYSQGNGYAMQQQGYQMPGYNMSGMSGMNGMGNMGAMGATMGNMGSVDQ